ncbi:MAG TPA: hypothetical protein VKZ63_08965, partial [Kofleriaceae bacterium]|nr:hypothetical protein [Kofleriaceae bacterium]
PARALSVQLLVITAAAAPAAAQPLADQPAVIRAEGVMTSGASVRSYATDWMVNPLPELEIGANLRFFTAPESPLGGDDDGQVRFTDLAVLRANLRHSFARRFEVAGSLDVLAKQPSQLDEPVLQGGSAGLRFALAPGWALWASGSGGPLLGDLGGWGEAGAGLQARTSLHETFRVQASLGGAGTRLFMGEASGRPWYGEVVGHGEALLRSPRGEMAGWLGVDYRIPVLHGDGNLDIDPQVRLGFQIGMMLGYIEGWDLYSIVSIVDRGDLEDPATTVPMLDGGFDQTQIVFGAVRHFDLADDEDEERVLQMIGQL